MWVKITGKLCELTQVVRNLRSVRERLDLLLAQFLRDDIKNRKKSGTEEDYEVLHRLLQQVADLARENSDVHVFVPEPEEEPDDPELSAIATGTCHGTVHGNSSSSNRPLPPAAPIQATPRVRRTPLRGTRGHNEATLAYLDARSDQEMQMRMLGHELDRERLALQIRQHDDKMQLHIRQHDDNVRLREQELELRKTELAALLEERRSSQVYQTAQLELIKALTEKLQK
ncbi:uncharacterized protein [Dermacentor andersoni]|uniref:uncharacterized protein n=1 Tax=Dermacentor andersoni TaxID=34620 RepID=UPI003B3ABF7E